jgi:hypothetical protein
VSCSSKPRMKLVLSTPLVIPNVVPLMFPAPNPVAPIILISFATRLSGPLLV